MVSDTGLRGGPDQTRPDTSGVPVLRAHYLQLEVDSTAARSGDAQCQSVTEASGLSSDREGTETGPGSTAAAALKGSNRNINGVERGAAAGQVCCSSRVQLSPTKSYRVQDLSVCEVLPPAPCLHLLQKYFYAERVKTARILFTHKQLEQRARSDMFSEVSGTNLSSNLSQMLDPLDPQDADWTDASQQRLSLHGHRVMSVFLGSIMVFGFVNNLLVLVLFCRFRTLRTPVNMLLLNISVSDLLVCGCGTTLSFASSLRSRWLFGRRGCAWYGFINSCLGIVSLVSLSVLSYDRYSTLMVYNKRPNYRRPLLAVGGSWLYSVAWTVPPLLGWSSYGLEGAGTSCSVAWAQRSSHSRSYVVCLFVFCLGLPVLTMAYCYGRLLYAVRQVGIIKRTAARRREFHILFMVVTTVVCYLLCWMPYGVVALMATFGRPGLISPVASVIPSILAKSSTVINPIIYILMNKQFYRCFLILFHCKSRLTEDGRSSAPSNSTVVQFHRRVRHSPAPMVPCQPDTEGTSATASERPEIET